MSAGHGQYVRGNGSRAKGATTRQPGASPRERNLQESGALKGRNLHATISLQGFRTPCFQHQTSRAVYLTGNPTQASRLHCRHSRKPQMSVRSHQRGGRPCSHTLSPGQEERPWVTPFQGWSNTALGFPGRCPGLTSDCTFGAQARCTDEGLHVQFAEHDLAGGAVAARAMTLDRGLTPECAAAAGGAGTHTRAPGKGIAS